MQNGGRWQVDKCQALEDRVAFLCRQAKKDQMLELVVQSRMVARHTDGRFQGRLIQLLFTLGRVASDFARSRRLKDGYGRMLVRHLTLLVWCENRYGQSELMHTTDPSGFARYATVSIDFSGCNDAALHRAPLCACFFFCMVQTVPRLSYRKPVPPIICLELVPWQGDQASKAMEGMRVVRKSKKRQEPTMFRNDSTGSFLIFLVGIGVGAAAVLLLGSKRIDELARRCERSLE